LQTLSNKQTLCSFFVSQQCDKAYSTPGNLIGCSQKPITCEWLNQVIRSDGDIVNNNETTLKNIDIFKFDYSFGVKCS